MRQINKILTVLASAIVLLCATAHSYEGKSVLIEANDYFLSGQYEEASVTYEQMIRSGYKDPTVYYNLSSAYMLLNMPGKAAVNLYRAKRLEPRGDDINKNLLALNSLLAERYSEGADVEFNPFGNNNEGGLKSTLLVPMTKSELAGAIFVLYLLFFIWSMIRKFIKPGAVKLTTGVLAATSYLFAMVFIVIFLSTFYYESFYPQAVVMETVELRTSPSEDESHISDILIHEGTLVELSGAYNGWGEVTFGGTEKTGWIDLTLLEKL